jgi:hypothetical protein
MPIIEGLLLSTESWFEVESTKEYQYPVVFSEAEQDADEPNASQIPPQIGHVSNIQTLPHFTGENHRLLYNENQLSKGNYNDNLDNNGGTHQFCYISFNIFLKLNYLYKVWLDLYPLVFAEYNNTRYEGSSIQIISANPAARSRLPLEAVCKVYGNGMPAQQSLRVNRKCPPASCTSGLGTGGIK